MATHEGNKNRQENGKNEELEKVVPVLDADGKKLFAKIVPPQVGYKHLPPVFSVEYTLNIPEFKLRDDDVVIASFPRSGCHWMFEILHMLQLGKLELSPIKKEDSMMEHSSEKEINQIPSPRTLNHHQRFEHQPKDLFRKKGKVIFVHRSLRDMITSYWHFAGKRAEGEFQHFLRRTLDGIGFFGSPIDYLLSWEKGLRENPDFPVFVCSFEELKKDPLPVLKAIAKFLDCKNADDQFLKGILDATDINKVRDKKAVEHQPSNMFRKGKTGDWKNVFTVAQDEWISQIIEDKLKDTRFYEVSQ